ncbi:hypothetical protein F0U59_27775 [Archangium gephyra]|nr:hypothetical protein F0U59_27775 [Archangium gephyra]
MAAQNASPAASVALELWLSVSEPAAFSWEQLAEQLRATYGAHTVAPILSGHKFVLPIQIPEPSLSRLLDDAERGELDVLAATTGARFIQEICQGNRCLYSYIPSVSSSAEQVFEDVSTDELAKLLHAHRIDVVLLSTTEVERNALHAVMTPLPGRRGLLEGAIRHVTYRLGQFGRYRVAHAESTMGSQARHAATLTVHDVISELSPKAIVIIGIAFGLNPEKQRLGDIIVAETVIPYELQRVDTKVTHRGQALHCGNILSERFRTRRADWKLKRGEDIVRVFQGTLLSGEKLVDSLDFRETLLKAFPMAIGGEMEGAGAYAATAREGVEVILVKAICDWGDGDKTDRAQPFAANAAVSLAHHIFSKKDVLAPLHARDHGLPESESSPVEPKSAPNNQLVADVQPGDAHSTGLVADVQPGDAHSTGLVADVQPGDAHSTDKRHYSDDKPVNHLSLHPLLRSRWAKLGLPFLGIAVLLLYIPRLDAELLFEPRLTLFCRLAPKHCLSRLEQSDAMSPSSTPEFEQLLVLSRWACEQHEDISSCHRLGEAHRLGQGVEKDLAKAVALYQQACSDQDARGCSNLGVAYEKGQGVEKDLAKAVVLYQQACSGQDARAAATSEWLTRRAKEWRRTSRRP